MGQRRDGRRWMRVLAACLTVGAAGMARAEGAAEGGVTDEQVVTAMKKGADFLLAQKKGDNWEPAVVRPAPTSEIGGVTALVLYSLLHTGQSLQDEPAYLGKLNWRSPEIAPAVAWLAKDGATGRSVVGLTASALALVPRGAVLGGKSKEMEDVAAAM